MSAPVPRKSPKVVHDTIVAPLSINGEQTRAYTRTPVDPVDQLFRNRARRNYENSALGRVRKARAAQGQITKKLNKQRKVVEQLRELLNRRNTRLAVLVANEQANPSNVLPFEFRSLMLSIPSLQQRLAAEERKFATIEQELANFIRQRVANL
jgi:hypothetical protein